MKPIAVMAITNSTAMSILELDDERVTVCGFIGDIHHYKLNYTNKGAYFTYCNGCRYYLNDFIRI